MFCSTHVLFEISNGMFCSMLDVLFDVLFDVLLDVLFYRHPDDQHVFAVLVGTQLVEFDVVFGEHVLFDVVFATKMSHARFCSWARSQMFCCVRRLV